MPSLPSPRRCGRSSSTARVSSTRRSAAIPTPRPGPGQLLGRVDAAGICSSVNKVIGQGPEHSLMYGRDLAAHPAILGDEGAITVVAVGEGVPDRFAVDADPRPPASRSHPSDLCAPLQPATPASGTGAPGTRASRSRRRGRRCARHRTARSPRWARARVQEGGMIEFSYPTGSTALWQERELSRAQTRLPWLPRAARCAVARCGTFARRSRHRLAGHRGPRSFGSKPACFLLRIGRRARSRYLGIQGRHRRPRRRFSDGPSNSRSTPSRRGFTPPPWASIA